MTTPGRPVAAALARLGVARCLIAFAFPLLTNPAPAQTQTTHPLPGVTCRKEVRQNPPQRLFSAEIDLSQPGLEVRVARGGPDPDGTGPWQTTLLPPTKIAAREGFDFVINGDFFRVRQPPDGSRPGYVSGLWAAATGPAASRGNAWSSNKNPTPCLVVRTDGTVRIAELTTPGPDIREAIAGNAILVKNGQAVAHKDQARHPRTVAGLRHQNGRFLVLLVVDGRRAKVANGMTYAELAAEMIRLGCQEALNLDGGGSSLMAVRDPSRQTFRILNAPTDGRERPVANALGIVIKSPPAQSPSKP